MSSLTLTADPPSYTQPGNYTYPPQQYSDPPTAQGYYQSAPYANEIAHMGSQHAPGNDNGYWQRTREEAVRLLGGQQHMYVHFPCLG
jgi:hypothetical protein